MKKSKWNFIIDVIMFIVMMAIIGIGLLNKYVLLTGQKKWDKFGNNMEFSWLGLDRQEWNDIHFILGLVLFGLLVLHILLHWKMMVNIYKCMIKSRGLRIFLAWIFLLISFFLVLFFLIAKPVVEEPASHFRNRVTEPDNQGVTITEAIPNEAQMPITDTLQKNRHHDEILHTTNPDMEINGTMTLAEVSAKYAVPADYLKQKLNIPLSTSNNERLGRLRRSLGFTMSEVEEIIVLYQKENNIKN